MNDEELLARLIGLFDSREEAEHVAACDQCDMSSSDGYEAGPYRCPDNPVTIKEEADRLELEAAGKVVWFLGGCPPMTELDWLMCRSAAMLGYVTEYTTDPADRVMASWFVDAARR